MTRNWHSLVDQPAQTCGRKLRQKCQFGLYCDKVVGDIALRSRTRARNSQCEVAQQIKPCRLTRKRRPRGYLAFLTGPSSRSGMCHACLSCPATHIRSISVLSRLAARYESGCRCPVGSCDRHLAVWARPVMARLDRTLADCLPCVCSVRYCVRLIATTRRLVIRGDQSTHW